METEETCRGEESKEVQEISLAFCSLEGERGDRAPKGKENGGSRMEGRGVCADGRIGWG
jgi:hypothetical protein